MSVEGWELGRGFSKTEDCTEHLEKALRDPKGYSQSELPGKAPKIHYIYFPTFPKIGLALVKQMPTNCDDSQGPLENKNCKLGIWIDNMY